jgi:hypothetical protein
MLTPQQIADHKQQWMSQQSCAVQLHSDHRSLGKSWCKEFLMKQQYVLREYTNVYEDTWFFENQSDADNFTACIKNYCDTAAASGVPGP